MLLPQVESMECPLCGCNGPSSSECPRCGIVYAKYREKNGESNGSSTAEPPGDDPKIDSESASEPTRFTLFPWLVGLIAIGVVAISFDAIRQVEPDSGAPQPAPLGPTSTDLPAVEKISPTAQLAKPIATPTDPMPAFEAAWTPVEDSEPLQDAAMEPQQTTIPSYTWYEGASGFMRGLEEAQQEGKALAVYFYTDWCAYCRELESELLTRVKVEDFLKYLVKIRINPENGTGERAIANEYGVSGYPSFFIQATAGASPQKIRRTRSKRLKSPEEFVATLEEAAR